MIILGCFGGTTILRKPPRFLDPLAQAVAECPRPAELGSPRGKWRFVMTWPLPLKIPVANEGLPPGRLTWNIIMEVWKIIFLSKWVICRFHVNLPGCKLESHSRHLMSSESGHWHLGRGATGFPMATMSLCGWF